MSQKAVYCAFIILESKIFSLLISYRYDWNVFSFIFPLLCIQFDNSLFVLSLFRSFCMLVILLQKMSELISIVLKFS